MRQRLLLISTLFALSACTTTEKEIAVESAILGAKLAAHLSPKTQNALEKAQKAIEKSQMALDALENEINAALGTENKDTPP